MKGKKIPKWKEIELKVYELLRKHFDCVYYQYPFLIRDEETKRGFLHKIDFVVEMDYNRYAIEIDGDIHWRSKRQANKTKWRNEAIRKAGYELIIVDRFEFEDDPEKMVEYICKKIEVKEG